MFALVQTRFVVLDEADMMLSMGFSEDVETILGAVPVRAPDPAVQRHHARLGQEHHQQHLKNPALVDLVGDAQSGKMPDSIK